MLRDPLQLADRSILIPHALAEVLSLCDGSRENAHALYAALALRGMAIPAEKIEQLLGALDQLYLLDNQQSRDAIARITESIALPHTANRSMPVNPTPAI